MLPPVSEVAVPGDLLQAVAQCTGRITIVVGAGCSLEAPTRLKLGWEYSKQAFDQLVADHELDPADCPDPTDLSALASAVMTRHGTQRQLVTRFPLDDFRFAKANRGYLLAAALMAEGAVAYVATLNFDLAMSNAITEVRPDGVKEVAGPETFWNFGSRAVIYLHRNVNEPDLDRWILRAEAIEEEWETGWEAVVSGRLAASPVVVFAGLGSPAAALTETLKRVRGLVPDATHAFVVDPAESTPFSEALDLPDANHIRAGWGDFMASLGQRVVVEFVLHLRDACAAFAEEHGCAHLDVGLDRLLGELPGLGLLGLGSVRSRWLGKDSAYEWSDPATRPHLADLSLAIAQLAQSEGAALSVHRSGVVTIARPDTPTRSVFPISGCGQHHWATLDPFLSSCATEVVPAPDVILAAAFRGTRHDKLAPPLDITGEGNPDSVAGPGPTPMLFDVDDLRSDPSLATAAGF